MIEQPIAAKTVNALIIGARAASGAEVLQQPADAASAATGGTGGLWVGGTALLFGDRLEFRPNGLNRSLHAGDVSAALPLSQVTAVHDRFGLLSGIIEVESASGGVFKLRGFGAKAFSAQIRDAVAAAR